MIHINSLYPGREIILAVQNGTEGKLSTRLKETLKAARSISNACKSSNPRDTAEKNMMRSAPVSVMLLCPSIAKMIRPLAFCSTEKRIVMDIPMRSIWLEPWRAFESVTSTVRVSTADSTVLWTQLPICGTCWSSAFSHNNSLNRESKHRLTASCFGKPKERAEARARL